jgi:hypothetical protein
MVTISMLTQQEESELRESLTKFNSLTTDGDLTKYLFEEYLCEGSVEVRAFPTPENGPAESVYFEVSVTDTAEWKEESLGSYSADNLQNGGPQYQALADELETIVKETLGTAPEFVKRKGSGAFIAEVDL